MSNFFRITPSASPMEGGGIITIILSAILSRKGIVFAAIAGQKQAAVIKTASLRTRIHRWEIIACEQQQQGEGGDLSVFRDIVYHLLPVTSDLTPLEFGRGGLEGGKWPANKV
ncbi:hypothetical protein CDAR_619231 [Caerostris darwini]|uniref:Uncharacterized protein n=1 Tax=Caerostris darwini TaxID=1538125 RepID=A0AAV4U2Z0_9ARAC|nr:hypothetical protein CDAR_619231 [Caerostris darwini]